MTPRPLKAGVKPPPGGLAKAVAGGLIAVAAVMLASCQPASEGPARLSLLEWNGYQLPEFYPEYIAKHGQPPTFTFFAEAEDALKRMRTGYRVDLVHLCTGQMEEARDAGLIRPLDPSRIPRWREITPELLELEGVQAEGAHWLVPWEWGYSTIAYNPELIEVENATYDLFIDPRFKGKTALTADIGVNLLVAGVIGGWADPLDPTEEEMAAAPEIFTKMLRNARFVWTDSTQLEQAWAAGDVGISYVYGSASRRMREEGLPIVVVEPLMTWLCGLSLTANDGGNDDLAYDYIDAMLDPASGVKLFEVFGYGHGNAVTVSRIDPDQASGAGIDDPVGLLARGLFNHALAPAKKAKLLQLWYDAQAGLD